MGCSQQRVTTFIIPCTTDLQMIYFSQEVSYTESYVYMGQGLRFFKRNLIEFLCHYEVWPQMVKSAIFLPKSLIWANWHLGRGKKGGEKENGCEFYVFQLHHKIQLFQNKISNTDLIVFRLWLVGCPNPSKIEQFLLSFKPTQNENQRKN